MLDITLADPRSPEAARLIAALTAEIQRLYPDDDGSAYFSPEDALPPYGAFLIARLAGEPVGCGALRSFGEPGIGEIKRMYVDPQARGQGIAARILARLEALARETGYHTLRLETGTQQPASLRLYQRMGYTRIDCYPPHEDCDVCICFEKRFEENRPAP